MVGGLATALNTATGEQAITMATTAVAGDGGSALGGRGAVGGKASADSIGSGASGPVIITTFAFGGAGAASKMTDAATGATDGGTLTLTQNAHGGAARSALTHDESLTAPAGQNAQVNAVLLATGGDAHQGAVAGKAGAAGTAAALAVITGAHGLASSVTVLGGNAPDTSSNGGHAGSAISSARSISTATETGPCRRAAMVVRRSIPALRRAMGSCHCHRGQGAFRGGGQRHGPGHGKGWRGRLWV